MQAAKCVDFWALWFHLSLGGSFLGETPKHPMMSSCTWVGSRFQWHIDLDHSVPRRINWGFNKHVSENLLLLENTPLNMKHWTVFCKRIGRYRFESNRCAVFHMARLVVSRRRFSEERSWSSLWNYQFHLTGGEFCFNGSPKSLRALE